jgi:hypothetical protein
MVRKRFARRLSAACRLKFRQKPGFCTESVIREMTRRALKCGAMNLAQGFPDFAAPQVPRHADKVAIDQEFNQYPSGKVSRA